MPEPIPADPAPEAALAGPVRIAWGPWWFGPHALDLALPGQEPTPVVSWATIATLPDVLGHLSAASCRWDPAVVGCLFLALSEVLGFDALEDPAAPLDGPALARAYLEAWRSC